ncbi:MAG: SDR family NAD(P)-dependent oxidoreductase, partial [SAR202 cluster bacterium]|nr:SDR family NAD(P)-dependent oxidoreductase [SAR202 cluster bacterium]
MDLGLTDKVAIITGASDGIGKAAARRIAAEGGTVMIIARTESTLNAAADELSQNSKGQVIPVVGDVCDPDLPKRVVEEAIGKFGRIDILVNNAGRSMAKHFDSVSDVDWEEDFDLKVWGAVRLIRAVIPEMRKNNGGRIINVTNLGGRT